jgi:hypothetical protein
MRIDPVEIPAVQVAAVAPRPAPAALDIAAYKAPLWIVEAPPPPPPPAPPPPPPLKLQLLAVITEGDIQKAAIYDPDTDRLFMVASGETVAGRMVENVDPRGVDLRDGKQVRRLALNPQEGGRP